MTPTRTRTSARTENDPATTTWDYDANPVPRLDRLPLPEAAAALGITEAQLRHLLSLGFELTCQFTGFNNNLCTPEELAAECGVTTRQLRNLEERGLPYVGGRKSKRYPWPLAEEWYRVFRRRTAQSPGLAITNLPPRQAWGEYHDAILLVRAYNFLTIHGGDGELDEASAARLPEAREYIRRREFPPYARDH
ncbi:hypothetical protein BH23GEM7_BH23GEM7_27180 [soil metagenome]|jgi:hypothetical protein